MGEIFRDTEEEVRLILPEQKIIAALGQDPRIRIYHGKDIRKADINSYNTALTNAAFRTRKELLFQYFPASQIPEFWHEYESMLNIKSPPQVLLKDSFGLEDDVIQLHLALMDGNELFLEDLALGNPFKKFERPPLPRQTYPGIGNGIFDETLANVMAYAKKQGLKLVSCQVVSWKHAEIFKKRGFKLDQRDFNDRTTPTLLEMAQQTGEQIPLYKEI